MRAQLAKISGYMFSGKYPNFVIALPLFTPALVFLFEQAYANNDFAIPLIAWIFAVGFHDLGHLLVLKLGDHKIDKLILTPIGCRWLLTTSASLQESRAAIPASARREVPTPDQSITNESLSSALPALVAGPIFSLMLGLLLLVSFPPSTLRWNQSFVAALTQATLILTTINILPLTPGDGAAILRLYLNEKHIAKPFDRYASLTQSTAAILLLAAFSIGSFTLAVFAITALFTVVHEHLVERLALSLKKTDLSSILHPASKMDVLRHGDVIDGAFKVMLRSSQFYFPVLLNTQAIGLLLRDQIIRALNSSDQIASVSALANRDITRLSVDKPLAEQLDLQKLQSLEVAVMEDKGSFVGLIYPKQLLQALTAKVNNETWRLVDTDDDDF